MAVWLLSLMLVATNVPGAELVSTELGCAGCPGFPAHPPKPAPRLLALRGGGLVEEQAQREKRMQETLDKLRGFTMQLEAAANADEDQVLFASCLASRVPEPAVSSRPPPLPRPALCTPRNRRPVPLACCASCASGVTPWA
jgi:hypothetical protein